MGAAAVAAATLPAGLAKMRAGRQGRRAVRIKLAALAPAGPGPSPRQAPHPAATRIADRGSRWHAGRSASPAGARPWRRMPPMPVIRRWPACRRMARGRARRSGDPAGGAGQHGDSRRIDGRRRDRPALRPIFRGSPAPPRRIAGKAAAGDGMRHLRRTTHLPAKAGRYAGGRLFV